MALVVTRKPGESAVITHPDGTRVTVTVGERKQDGRVKLVFDAPPYIIIDRSEIDDLKTRSETDV